jgi:hypothetical protein
VEGTNRGKVIGNPSILLERLCKTTKKSVDTATLHPDIRNWWFQISVRCANHSLAKCGLYSLSRLLEKERVLEGLQVQCHLTGSKA